MSYWFPSLLAAAAVALNLVALPYDRTHPDLVIIVIYLWLAGALMNIPQVRMEHGGLSLNGVVSWAAVLTLNPLNATLVGTATVVMGWRRGLWRMYANVAVSCATNCVGAFVAIPLHPVLASPVSRLVVILTLIVCNLAFTSAGLWAGTGEPVTEVVRKTFTRPFFAAFGYLALAALLISYLLDGSVLGYVLASIVCVLALALTDTIAGRRVRTGLELELSDADRHLVHSRAVEGVVHNLRNHMANAQAYLREIDTRKLDSVDRESLETATEAANDAVAVLRSLAQGATPKVSFSPNPVDLNELAARAIGMARPRARTKEVQLGIRESAADVKVRADPLLLREVMTNLVNNAIDAAPEGGRVDLSTGRRTNGSPFVSVADNGPGVTEDHRHHLFEPHFTTKEGGTGLGLFMSYGIVREHQGQLIYEGNRRGAVFTVTLPPYRS